jgi:hypothetical protein
VQDYRGCWICEARVGQCLWKRGLQDEYSVLLSCYLCCSSSVISRNNISQCTTISLCQWRFSPAVPLRWCLSMICVCRHNNLSSFKIGQVSYFLILSHGLSLNIITKALIQAIQSVNKQKDIQCYEFNAANINSIPQFLSVSIIFSTLCIWADSPVLMAQTGKEMESCLSGNQEQMFRHIWIWELKAQSSSDSLQWANFSAPCGTLFQFLIFY